MSEPVKERRLVLELVGDSRAPIELPRAGVLSIGSSKGRADMHIEGQGVADVHCAIGRIKGGGWALKDLGSEFGTFVNGERVQSRRLEIGDQLLVGSRRLRVVDPDQAPAPVKSSAPTAPPPQRTEQRTETAPPVAAPTPRAASTSDTAMRARAGESNAGGLAALQIKGYRVERALGRGGMGEVYLAVQESLDRKVALKVLAAKLAADADFVRRFQAEARAAAALNHPNVVTVHDVWEENGRHFLSMEFMDKGNLETRVARDGRISATEALEILSDTAKALVYAEMRGIVHRDIKPANLMQNLAGATKLADLGLATHLEAEATESDNKKIYGTPHFISPEQARGEKVDCRSDLYSLGATVYRLLSGHTPFEGATTRDILRGHFFEEPKPLAELAPDVPPDLARIVHRLLKKKPDERFLSAGVLLQEVERLRSGALHGVAAHSAPKKSNTRTYVVLGGIAFAIVLVAMFLRGKPKPDTSPPVNVATSGTTNTKPPEVPTPEVTPAPPVRPHDDDTALKLREIEAENASLKLPHDLTRDERRAELLRLASEFAGTRAADKFQTEAEELRQESLRQENLLTEHERQVGETLERIRRAALVGENRQPLGAALRAMLAEPMAADLVADPGFVGRRKQLLVDVVHAALQHAQEALDEVQRMTEAGTFTGIEEKLRPLLGDLDLHEMPAELNRDVLPELDAINGLRELVREKLDGLERVRNEFTAHLVDADRQRIAGTFRAPQGLESELRHLDFAACDARLAKLESELETPEARAFATSQRAALKAAQQALEMLGGEFDKGNWRRKQVIDPRSKARVSRDAVGANAQGVLLKVENNSDLVPWSAFGGRPAELHQLFHQRLSRDYTHDELVGIEALVRLAAVLQAVDEASDMLMPGPQAVLTEDEARSMVEGFDLARTWALALGETSACERETQAARVLADALRAKSNGAWSAAVSGTERLLNEFSSTLLVRFLSDGRAPQAAPPRPPAPIKPDTKPSDGQELHKK